jgi:hypothetical protein
MTDAAPILDGYVTKDGINVCVWCVHCRRWHYHGHHDESPGCTYTGRGRCVCPIGSGDGHRVPHCHDPASPYNDTGYVIREVGYITDAELRKPQRQTIRGAQK